MDLTGIGSAFDFAGNLLNRFFPAKMDETEKTRMAMEMAQAIDQRDTVRDHAKADVIKSEMAQGDAYTKRARPTVVYMGLAFIALVHVFFPIMAFFTGEAVPELKLPTEFWYTWGGVCSVWMIGRSMEKKSDDPGKIIRMITGNK
jgi:hypothetical protein